MTIEYLAGNRIRGTSTERGNYPTTVTSGFWDVSTGVEVGSAFSGTAINTLFMKPDGTQLYTLEGNDLKEYSLSVAFDITSTLTNTSTMTIGFGSDKLGLEIGDGGTKIYIGTNGTDSIYQYNMATAWDLSTVSYSNNVVSCSCLFPTGINFNTTGTKMIVSAPASEIATWSLSTAWDLSTATKGTTYTLTDTTDTRGLFIKPDGMKFWCCDVNASNLEINEYALATAWDLSTLSYVDSLIIGDFPNNVSIKSDGTSMFVAMGGTGSGIDQYDIGFTSVLTVQDGSIFYETDTNKSYVLYSGSWSEL